MWNVLKNELKRSLFNKWILIAMLVTSIFCLLQFKEMYEGRMGYFEAIKELGFEKSEYICTGSAYENWIMFENYSMYRYIFLFIFPILAVMPYGMSYYMDVRSGYIKQMVSRMSMKTYARAKYIATFVSGGVAITVPMIMNFLFTATIFPMHKPYRFLGNMFGEQLLSGLFYNNPLIYTLFKLLLIFVVSGLMATISLLVSKYIFNYFSVFITPFVLTFLLEFSVYITEYSYVSFSTNLRAEIANSENLVVLLSEILIMFVITYVGFVRSKTEVY